jgi:hypothetical protein
MVAETSPPDDRVVLMVGVQSPGRAVHFDDFIRALSKYLKLLICRFVVADLFKIYLTRVLGRRSRPVNQEGDIWISKRELFFSDHVKMCLVWKSAHRSSGTDAIEN